LRLVRVRGWAAVPNELFLGTNAIAAPIFNQFGGLEGSLALLGSLEQIPETPPSHMLASLLGAAGRISRNLGYSDSNVQLSAVFSPSPEK
jgi:DNA-binding IclR family transcriptional regulator